jgi:putative DNA primase/helicase
MMTARDLADRLQLRKYPRSWRGRCPRCDYSGSVFSVREGKNGRTLLYCANGCDSNHLKDAINRTLGGIWTSPRQSDSEDNPEIRERNQMRALRLWRGSEPVPGTLAEQYLTRRGIGSYAASNALRFRGDCHHPESGSLPALVALVQALDEAPLGVHRTYLSRDGSKTTVEPAKASLGPVWGGAVRLDPPRAT